MDSLISIIVDAKANHCYFDRFIDSLKRQTYSCFEIIFISDVYYDYCACITNRVEFANSFSDAIILSKGDYILFSSLESVFAPQTISSLVTNLKNRNNGESNYLSCSLFDYRNNKLIPYEKTRCTIIGKVTTRSYLTNTVIDLLDDKFGKYLFPLNYFCDDNTIEDADILIKDSFHTLFELFDGVNDENRENLVKCVSREDRLSYLNATEKAMSDQRLLNKLSVLRNLIENEEIDDTYVANNILSFLSDSLNILRKSKKNETNYEVKTEAFHSLANIFECISKYPSSQYIYSILNLDEKMINVMKNYDIDFYNMFVINQSISELAGDTSFSLELLESKLLDSLSKRMEDTLKKVFCQNQKDSKVAENNKHNSTSGTELAEYNIGLYKEGRLGFKTILKSVKAWLIYKCGGKHNE